MKESILPKDYNTPKEIKYETQMTSWFGKDRTGKDVMIDEETFIDLLNEYFKSKDLLDHCKKNDWIVLPDDTRLVCSLKGAVEQKWDDIYTTLKKVLDNHNKKVKEFKSLD